MRAAARAAGVVPPRRRGIDDRRMLSAGTSRRSVTLCRHRVGRVDDAEGRLAARDERKCRAHVLGPRDLFSTRGPYTECLQRALPYLPAGYAVRIGDGQPPRAERTREGKSGAIWSEAVLPPARSAPAVAQQVTASRRKQLARLEIVHPVVSAETNSPRRARFDLPRQRVAGGVANDRLVALAAPRMPAPAGPALPSGSPRQRP